MFSALTKRPAQIIGMLIVFASAYFGIPGTANAQSSGSVPLRVEGNMPSLSTSSVWLNSKPLTAKDLHGKVVLVDFWTYSCINWRRTVPYLRAWAAKYKDQGLIVVGVHSPEFGFEKSLDNVRWAIQDMKVEFPVLIDNDFNTWRSFSNQYWPALYFVDGQGQIRHHQFGEGGYEESEKVIQTLLAEAGRTGVGSELVSVTPVGIEVAADWANLRSPENYVGYLRTEKFSSAGGAVPDAPQSYSAPRLLELNHWALSGSWTMQKEAAVLNQPNGRITYRFHARDLHIVMGPAKRGKQVRFRVLIDGKPPGAAHGTDIDEQGNGRVIEQRLYNLIRQTSPILDRQIDIEFLDPGVEAFSFTFG